MKNAQRTSPAALAAAACLLATLLAPTVATAQGAPAPFVQVRGAWAGHLAGLVVRGSEPRFDYQHRLAPAAAFGVGAGAPLGAGTFGLRLDFDEVPGARLEQGTTGPLLEGGQPGPLWWLTGSAYLRPAPLCGVVCLAGTAGVGIGRYPFDNDQVSGDIAVRFIRPQTRPALRFGLELSLPRYVPGLVLYASDYVSDLHGSGPGQQSVTPMHVLLAGAAFAWNP